MKGFTLFLFLSQCIIIYSQNNDKINLSYKENGEIILVVDHNFHLDYGCSYPITFKFEILQNSSKLNAFYRHSKYDYWNQLVEKYTSDFLTVLKPLDLIMIRILSISLLHLLTIKILPSLKLLMI